MHSQMTAPSKKIRLEFLDTLRGLAACYVVLYHMVLLPKPNLAVPVWADKFAHTGGTGVTLFFLVSAFSLFYTMPLRLAKPKPVVGFYMHRFFRIAPLFYFIIIATIIRDKILFGAKHTHREILSSVFFVFNLDPLGQQGFVWASWTIGVEMLFYVVFPVIYFRTKNIYSAISWVIGFLILWQVVQLGLDYSPLTPQQHDSIVQWSVFRHFPIFAMGAVIFYLVKSHIENPHPVDRTDQGHMLLLLGVFGYMALLNGWLPDVFGLSYYWQGVIYGLLLTGLCLAPLKIIVNRITEHLGKVSYSLYLVHPTVVYLLIPTYQRVYKHVHTASAAMILCYAMTLAIVLLISEFTFRLVEEPGIKLGKIVYRKWVAGTTPAVSPSSG
jgi:peptidoglycan/LPS O-acetylase OafA/YrhL